MRNIQHKDIDGTWQKKPFLEQLANIGSDVYRAINWKQRGNEEYAEEAFVRSLELLI